VGTPCPRERQHRAHARAREHIGQRGVHRALARVVGAVRGAGGKRQRITAQDRSADRRAGDDERQRAIKYSPQNNEPQTASDANASARTRPCAIAVPMAARTPGPGLATPITDVV
jgi:hypothetical protein